MLLFRRVQGGSRPSKSGNRPKFKTISEDAPDEEEEEDEEAGKDRYMDMDRCVRERLQSDNRLAKLTLPMLLLLLLVSVATKTANCDQIWDPDELKVAALATKLEHWFVCRQAQSISSAGTGPASGQTTASHGEPSESADVARLQVGPEPLPAADCQAHYDGHLCWPPTPSGGLAKLPCPRVNWLPSRHMAAKSVISSIQAAQAQAIEVEPSRAEARSIQATAESINKPTSRMMASGEQQNNITNEPIIQLADAHKQQQQGTSGTRFAYRKCSPGQDLSNNESRAWSEADYSSCQATDGNATTGPGFDPTDEWINLDQAPDKQLFARLIDELDRFEASIDPYSDPDLQEQWSLCIGDIMRHQRQQVVGVNSSADQKQAAWCPIIFDGWRCWPSTRAGEVAYVGCPRNQPGFSAERKAHKICTSDGTWYRHPMTNRYWSNYTTCVDTVDLAFRTKILNLYIIGNLISLIALSASLIIFMSFKSLNCTRVTIHKNLFLSFITNNLMWIIWYTYVVNDADLLQKNPIECQLWHILLHYFLVSNYFWMFCEGLYLHTLLVVAFVSENKILKWFYLLGWLTPVPIIVAYAYNRSYDDYYTSYCWMEESPYNLILMAPIGISLLLNLVFLINIVRVLVTKLRANNSPDAHQTRKAVRATLILIPLLGLHYILTPFRPEAKSEWEGIYESVAAVCTSFQGLCVAMLFCFCNGEVMTVIKKKIKDTFNLSHSRQRSSTGGGGGGCGSIGGCGDYMRNRSNTTCTSIGVMAPNFNQFTGTTRNSTDSQQTQAGIPVASLPNKLFQNRTHSLASSTMTNVNGTNSNTSNSSSLLTSITISPLTTALAQPNSESNPMLLASIKANTEPCPAVGAQAKNILSQDQPTLGCRKPDKTLLDEQNNDLVKTKEESVKLLDIEPERADASVTTSFSIPM